MLKREAEQAFRTVKTKLLVDFYPVIFDGPVMNAEFFADLFAGLVFGDHMQNPSFGRGQILESRFTLQEGMRLAAAMEEVTCKRATHIKLAGRNGANRFSNLDQSTIF